MSPKRPNKHDPDAVALVKDISGFCGACKKNGNARLVVYYSGEMIIRCNSCKKAGQFIPDNATYNDPRNFAPFIYEDEDEDETGSGRYTKGKR